MYITTNHDGVNDTNTFKNRRWDSMVIMRCKMNTTRSKPLIVLLLVKKDKVIQSGPSCDFGDTGEHASSSNEPHSTTLFHVK
eukprot:scaffold23507_cov153-Cylindrotheca_fusiformis.AAC.2